MLENISRTWLFSQSPARGVLCIAVQSRQLAIDGRHGVQLTFPQYHALEYGSYACVLRSYVND